MIAMQECFKLHPTLHLVTGLGLGFLLAVWVPGLANVALGLILIVVSVGAHFFVGGQVKKTV